MVIKSLKLRNYRRFEQLELELPENIIGIMGRNGAGKSTIIEAIGWTLYGNRFVRTDKMDVRSQHADESSTCGAEMVFVYGGVEYRIERKLKGKSAISEAAVWREGNNEPEAVQDRGVNEFIENLLQLDHRSFLTSVFAEQKDLAKLSGMRPEERRQAINRLINIDRIDRAREAVRHDANDKSRELSGKRSAAKDLDELMAREKSLRQEQVKLAAKCLELEGAAAARESELGKIKELFNASSLVRDQYLNWEAQIGKLLSRQEEQTKNLRNAQMELEQVVAAENELSGLMPRLQMFDEVKARKEALDAEREKDARLASRRKEKEIVLTSLAKENKSLAEAVESSKNLSIMESELAKLVQTERLLDENLQTLRNTILAVHGLKATAKNKGQELAEKLAKIQELGADGECPVCTQRLGDHFGPVVEDHETQLNLLRQEYLHHKQEEEEAQLQAHSVEAKLRQARRDQQELGKKVQSAQDAHRRADEIRSHIQNYEQQMSLIDQDILALGAVSYDESEHQKVKQSYETLLALQQQASRLEERANRRTAVEAAIRAAQQTLQQLADDAAAARSSQDVLNFDESQYQRDRQNVEAATQAFNTAKDVWGAVRQDLAVLKRDLENLVKEIEEQKRLRQEMESVEEEIRYLGALEEYLGQFRLDLAGRVRPLIARRASELLALTTNSRYSQIELDQDYNIRIYDGNRAFPIDRFSGGEQDLTNLCLRIAVSQVVAERHGGAPINFIVLDEIFGSQDVERRELILNALGQLSTQFRQIFIITHIEMVRDVLPVLVEVEIVNEFVSRARLV
jgi:DNA repair protein SbcC/Rad50